MSDKPVFKAVVDGIEISDVEHAEVMKRVKKDAIRNFNNHINRCIDILFTCKIRIATIEKDLDIIGEYLHRNAAKGKTNDD